jgi:hypothetical protein
MLRPGIPEKAIKGLSIRNRRDPKKITKTRPNQEDGRCSPPIQLGGQLMCHEVCITRCKYVEDSIGSTWAFYAPAQIL